VKSLPFSGFVFNSIIFLFILSRAFCAASKFSKEKESCFR